MPNPIHWLPYLPWMLLVLGIVSLAFSTILYPHYLRGMKRLWSSRGICGRLGGAIFGAEWIQQVQTELSKYEPTTGRKWLNGILSLVMIAAGAFVLWLRG